MNPKLGLRFSESVLRNRNIVDERGPTLAVHPNNR